MCLPRVQLLAPHTTGIGALTPLMAACISPVMFVFTNNTFHFWLLYLCQIHPLLPTHMSRPTHYPLFLKPHHQPLHNQLNHPHNPPPTYHRTPYESIDGTNYCRHPSFHLCSLKQMHTWPCFGYDSCIRWGHNRGSSCGFYCPATPCYTLPKPEKESSFWSNGFTYFHQPWTRTNNLLGCC